MQSAGVLSLMVGQDRDLFLTPSWSQPGELAGTPHDAAPARQCLSLAFTHGEEVGRRGGALGR